jgi:hypothetical protein
MHVGHCTRKLQSFPTDAISNDIQHVCTPVMALRFACNGPPEVKQRDVVIGMHAVGLGGVRSEMLEVGVRAAANQQATQKRYSYTK